MSEHTHCDRCGAVGAHKGDSKPTREFPAAVKLRADTNAPMARAYTRELCRSCAVELALFIADEKLADRVGPGDHRDHGADDANGNADGYADGNGGDEA